MPNRLPRGFFEAATAQHPGAIIEEPFEPTRSTAAVADSTTRSGRRALLTRWKQQHPRSNPYITDRQNRPGEPLGPPAANHRWTMTAYCHITASLPPQEIRSLTLWEKQHQPAAPVIIKTMMTTPPARPPAVDYPICWAAHAALQKHIDEARPVLLLTGWADYEGRIDLEWNRPGRYWRNRKITGPVYDRYAPDQPRPHPFETATTIRLPIEYLNQAVMSIIAETGRVADDHPLG